MGEVVKKWRKQREISRRTERNSVDVAGLGSNASGREGELM